MKKVLALLTLPLLLAGCGNNSLPTGSKAAITASVDGGEIDIERKVNKDFEVLSFKSETTQPSINFYVAPGSTGVTFTRYRLQLQDNKGAAFGDDITQYERSIGYRVEGGWSCTNSETLIGCTPQNLVPSPRYDVYGGTSSGVSATIIQSEVADRVVNYFAVAGVCPDLLRMDITLYGYDDNRNAVTINIDDANIAVTCNTVLEGE